MKMCVSFPKLILLFTMIWYPILQFWSPNVFLFKLIGQMKHRFQRTERRETDKRDRETERRERWKETTRDRATQKKDTLAAHLCERTESKMVVVEVQSTAENNMEEVSAGEDLVRKLEDFFISPEIMVAIGDFMHDSVQKLYFVGAQSQENNQASLVEGEEEEETHPIENYEIFSAYGAMIEEMLDKFLQEQKADANDLYTACLEEKLHKGNAWAVCLDYLLASLDYEFFLTVAHDFYQMQVDDN